MSVPTHSDSCLDHLYTNRPDKLVDTMAIENGGSDHKLIYTVRHSKSLKRNVRYVKKRCFKKFNEDHFRADIKSLSWFDIYMCDDIETAVEKLAEKITVILDRHAPIRMIQVRSKYAPWLTDATKEMMQRRNIAQKISTVTKTMETIRNYKNLRNTVTRLIRNDKKNWEKARLNHLTNSTNSLWSNVSKMLTWSKSGPPTQLYCNGKMESRPKALAETLNSFFISKVNRLIEGLPVPMDDPLRVLKKIMHNRSCRLTLRPVHPKEVLKLIMGLKNTQSEGLDYISMYIVRLIAGDILPSLTHIINLSIRDSKFPTKWKAAKVVPLLKKGDAINPQNYRPVALLPALSKVLEKVIFRQIVEYMEKYDLMHHNHHGSRSGHNTSTALIEMYDNWTETVERGNCAAVMMLDLSAAFDLVNHSLLLQKLHLMGFDGHTINWCKSYLGGRSQCVYVDGQFSELKPVSVGVPQGSVLGALFYILFVNDLPGVIHDDHLNFEDLQSQKPWKRLEDCSLCGALCCYVDDSTYTYSCNNVEEMKGKLAYQYRQLSAYFRDNRLVINDSKTQLVIVGPRKHQHMRNEVFVDTGSVLVHPKESGRLLGVNIHQSLKWKYHVMEADTSVLKCLTSRLNSLKSKAANASFKSRLLLANAYFMSSLIYTISVWGGAEKYLVKAIQVLQNKAARYVSKQHWFTPTKTLLTHCGWLSVKQMIMYHRVLQIWKMIYLKQPEALASRLQLSNTRSRIDLALALPDATTQLRRKSFYSSACHSWNLLPTDIRKSCSQDTFKKKVKKWISINVDIE